ncbi:replicative DNA helicase [Amphiplicatus metriothermophilus]|uniref:Replicative DNA helicase n=1 Tax=Amphiplicatus metriothermophilus TaxID=1519374 RepID=A0A239PXV7_9PROT|nr:replicative DNA helicase [Amphiplicatus metriothermophilus]MBB5519864.1 replicative DNA helicase [Amphiplicatus metriothermophilus]SNT75085.1 primary replicative DNA helicase [Amphiplicatus metriothermophilus]
MADGADIKKAPQGGPNKPDTEEKIPFSIEAEQALLGAILFDNEVYYRVAAYLKAEHFYDPVHALIYDACERLVTSGRLAAPTIIDSFLASSEGFREAGGRRYLEELARNVPTTAGAPDYARVVFDHAVRRGLINIGAEMIERAREATLDDEPARQLQDAEQSLYKLAETGKYGGGFKTFRAAITEAIEIADAAIKRDGGLAGIATGLRDLDMMLGGLHPSDLIILAGRPSMGKTSLAVNIAVNAARAYKPERLPDGSVKAAEGAVVGLFSLEMAAEQLATRIISEFSGVPSNEIRRGRVDAEQFDRIYHAARELEALPLYIDDTGGLSIAQLAARARRLKRQHGLGLLVVDYLQLVTGSGRRASDNRVQEITEISQGLKALAKELNVPVLALSQLSRQVENRDDKRPQLADLRESGSIEQDADVVLFVFREEYYLKRSEPREGTPEHAEWLQKCEEVRGVAEVIIGKQRHGPIGKVDLYFDESLTKFSNLDRGIYDEYRRD